MNCDDGGLTLNECAQACEAQAGCFGFGQGGAGCDGETTRGGNSKWHCNLQKEYTCDVNPAWDWHALGSGTKRSTTWYAEGGSSTYGFVESASFLHLADLRIWKGKQLDISAFNLDEVQDWNYPYKTDGAGLPARGLASPTWQANGWHLPDDGFVCNNDEPPSTTSAKSSTPGQPCCPLAVVVPDARTPTACTWLSA